MNERVKNVLLVVSGGAALALGGAAIAGAGDGNGSSNDAAATGTNDPGGGSGPARQRGDEQVLSGATAEQVRQAALGRISGGTIDRLETDADGHAQYEAHMRDADGNRVTVYVNADFEVVELESGR
jgi:uncharacterized membrane protein YkoI